ncbi:MAG: SDR family NAD(P)-dependent oxidoreductase [Bryobacteraceae bacterium]
MPLRLPTACGFTLMDFAERVALITGASEGLGAATARALERRGVRLALVARTESRLRDVSPGALHLPGDLTDARFRSNLAARVLEHYGRLDILVNNAAVGLYAPSWRAPLEATRAMFELNWYAPLDLIQQVVPHMRERRSGMIVNISSIAGQMTLPWFTLYSASKSALGALSDGLRMELAASGVRVMLVLPGYMNTGFQKHVLSGAPPPRLVSGKRFGVTADECAAKIVAGIERDARTIVTPSTGRWIVGLFRLAPTLVEAQLRRIQQSSEGPE